MLYKKIFFISCFLVFFAFDSFVQVQFDSTIEIETTNSPNVVSCGDLNNDGLNDVVIALGTGSQSYQMNIYYQSESGQLEEPFIIPYAPLEWGTAAVANGIEVGDINSDGLNDIALAYSDTLAMYYQTEDGLLSSPDKYYSDGTVYGVRIGDMNGDLINDVAITHRNDASVKLFYGNGDGFDIIEYAAPEGASHYDEIEIGDVNNDGLNDLVLVTSNHTNSAIHLYNQNADGILDPYISYAAPQDETYIFPANLQGIALGDLNGNGLNDIVALKHHDSSDNRLVFWYQDPITNDMMPPSEIEIVYSQFNSGRFTAIELGDFNCDEKMEIAALSGSGPYLHLFSMEDGMTYSHFESYSNGNLNSTTPAAQCLDIEDINGDGLLDIVNGGIGQYLNIALNESIPTEFSEIQVSVEEEVVAENILTESFTEYSITDTLFFNDFLVLESDNYFAWDSLSIDSIAIDSTLIRIGELCDMEYKDTLLISSIIGESELLWRDSTFVNTTIDTLIINSVLFPELSNITEFIKIYPNPSAGEFTLASEDFMHSVSASIINIYGEVVQTYYFESLIKETLNTELSSGCYIICISTRDSKGIIRKRIIIE